MSEECEDKQRFDNFPIPIHSLDETTFYSIRSSFSCFHTKVVFSLEGDGGGSVGKKSGYLIFSAKRFCWGLVWSLEVFCVCCCCRRETSKQRKLSRLESFFWKDTGEVYVAERGNAHLSLVEIIPCPLLSLWGAKLVSILRSVLFPPVTSCLQLVRKRQNT